MEAWDAAAPLPQAERHHQRLHPGISELYLQTRLLAQQPDRGVSETAEADEEPEETVSEGKEKGR